MLYFPGRNCNIGEKHQDYLQAATWFETEKPKSTKLQCEMGRLAASGLGAGEQGQPKKSPLIPEPWYPWGSLSLLS